MSTFNQTPSEADKASGLADFGYTQQLDRVLSKYAVFALAFAYMSILTGVTALFGSGWYFAGPAMWWGWVIVSVGQFFVCLLFAELAAQWPVAGSLYNWSKKLAAPFLSWLSGWFVALTVLLTIGSITSALAILLPQISPVFQLVGDGTGPYDVVQNAVIVGSICLVLVTVLNLANVKLVGRLNNWAVIIEFVLCACLIVGFLLHAHRGPSVVMETNGTGAGHSFGWLGALVPAMLIGLWTLYGFDTAASMAEETKNPRREGPRAIIYAVVASAILGAIIIMATEMAVKDLADPNIATGGLSYMVTSTFGSFFGTLILLGAVIALFACVTTAQSYGARMIFAMARDNRLPFSRQLSKVNGAKEPIVAIILVCVSNIAVLLLNVQQTQIVAVLASVGTALIYLAYLLVTIPLLIKRLRGTWPIKHSAGQKEFSLGKWGLPANIVAVIWGVAMVLNLIWPRAEVYNATAPYHWYLQWGGVLTVLIVTAAGALYYAVAQRGERSATLMNSLAQDH
ncbi:amino acid permease [Pseudomonas sp. dw_358]|uniref:APC family permease n=1 Tax=Pseudomonas sp. dw_358 TaxID=2720083 RepID=UPI001BD381A2|nr:amino acid permease [Pseudomonas sp. dw_358]